MNTNTAASVAAMTAINTSMMIIAAEEARKAGIVKAIAILKCKCKEFGMKKSDLENYTGRQVMLTTIMGGMQRGRLEEVGESTAIISDKKSRRTVVALDYIVTIDLEN